MLLKKIMLIILSCVFLLTSCLNFDSSDDINKTPIENQTENPLTPEQLNFGDEITFVKSTDDNLEDKLLNLSTKIKGEKNSIYQSNYQQGLLDLFNIDNKVEIVIYITNEQIEYLNQNHYMNNKESYQKCDLDIILNNIKYHYKNVGIRQKGNLSRGEITTEDKINLRHYKLNFAETFDDEYRLDKQEFSKEQLEYMKTRSFFGLQKLDLRWNRNRDQSYIREYYSYEMYRQNGILSSRSNVMNVKFNINKKTQNLGLYLGVEPIDSDFISRNFEQKYEGGDLYKLGWSNQGATFTSVDSKLFGIETQTSSKDGYKQEVYPYDLKTNKKTSSHKDIKNFISKIISTSNTNSYETIKEITHYNSFIKYLAISYLLGDPDDLRGNYNNTYIYFIPELNKAIFIPTDHDRTLGSTGGTGNPTGHHGAANTPFDTKTGYGGDNISPLFTKTILYSGNTTIKNDYFNEIQNILSKNIFTYESFLNVYKKTYNNYANDILLGNNVNDSPIYFGIDEEDKNLDSDWNLNVEVYIKTKREYTNKK